MNKTIEKLASQYAEDMCPLGDYCGGVYDEQRNTDLPIYTDDAKSVLSWLFAKPLASRLTSEEKEIFREMYGELRRKWWETKDKYMEADAFDKIEMMETIFGADFFKEG